MKTTYTKFILLLAATTFIACNEEEAPSLHISASADKTEVKVGEPVTFSIRHNAMAVSITPEMTGTTTRAVPTIYC